jgi:adenylylsulfate kinase-like enzyme
MNKKFGILFRISGLPGSGKTEVAKLIHPKISKIFGPTLMYSGDDLRRITNNDSYKLKDRFNFGLQNIALIKLINTQKINVIFATVGLSSKIRKQFKKKIPNYIEITIKSQFSDLKKRKDRKFYNDNSKNVWGRDIKIEYPKKSDVIIVNNFKKNLNHMKNNMLNDLTKLKKLKNFII